MTTLITGCASRFARRLAERLSEDPRAGRLVGLDYVLPASPAGRMEAHRLDVLDGGLLEFLRRERVQAIVHLLWVQEPLDARTARRVNVDGTRALAAAAAAAGVGRLVFKSSTSAYGASARHPLFLSEEAALGAGPDDARAEHCLEAEAKIASVAAASRDQSVGGVRGGVSSPRALSAAVLRFAPILGAAAESRLSAYLRPRAVPTALGVDPRMQLVHEDDVIGALAHALASGFTGTANVAAPGVLPLHRVLRLLGRRSVPLPRPLLSPALALHALLAGRPHLRMAADALRAPPVGDLSRMRDALGYRPAREAIDVVKAEAARIAEAAREGSPEDQAARREADIERDRAREASLRIASAPRGGARHE